MINQREGAGEMKAIRYVINLSKKHTNSLAFIPSSRLEEDFMKGQIWLQNENDEPCGFLHFTRGFPNLHITNACIQIDAQRRKHALALVRKLIKKADDEGYESISLWCASDLEANEFWRSCGFTFVRSTTRASQRGRVKNLWMMWMPRPLQMMLIG